MACASCGAHPATPPDAAPPNHPSCENATDGPPQMLDLFPTSRVSGVNTASGYRTIFAYVNVPDGCFSKVELRYVLTGTCADPAPMGQVYPTLCDPWPRITQISLSDSGQTPVLLFYGITPYGGNAEYVREVTDYHVAMAGTHRYGLFISSAADGTGMQAGTNAGWTVQAQLVLTPGRPPREVSQVSPLFLVETFGVATPQPVSADITAPNDATRARVDFYATGHRDCVSCMNKPNLLLVDGAEVFRVAPWADCSSACRQTPGMMMCNMMTFTSVCADNPFGCPDAVVSNFAGWCVGEQVQPGSVELAPDIATGKHTIGWKIPDIVDFFTVGAAAVFYR